MELIVIVFIPLAIVLLWLVTFVKTFRSGDEDAKMRIWFFLFATLAVLTALFLLFVLPEFYCTPYLCNVGALVMAIIAGGLTAIIFPVIQLGKLAAKK